MDRELAEMDVMTIGKTASRQVTGVMVEYARLVATMAREPDPVAWSLHLADTLMRASARRA